MKQTIQPDSVPPGDKPMFTFVHPYIHKETTVLDIGCADCSFISLFPSLNKKNYMGIEQQKKLASLATQKEYHVLCMNIERKDPAFKKKFSVILAKDVLEHFEHPDKVLRKIYSSLTDNGDFFLSVPSELSLLIWDDYTHKRGFSPRALRELLTNNGFTIIQLGKDRSLFHPKRAFRYWLSLSLFQKFTGLDFLTQNYLVHAKKRENVNNSVISYKKLLSP